jgi:hypothetical protein
MAQNHEPNLPTEPQEKTDEDGNANAKAPTSASQDNDDVSEAPADPDGRAGP